jgi:succinyl-diaminopimelate desuccinylase
MNDTETLLAALIKMPTVTDDVAANGIALDYIEHYFSKRGLYCQRFTYGEHGALVASSRPDNAKHPVILLAAHIDVVTGEKGLFHLRKKDGKLLGRGVYDMKFAIAGYMKLIEELGDKTSNYDFAIMITSDEEYGGRDGVNGTRSLVDAGYRPSVCLLPDSAAPGWNIEKLAKGYWRFDLLSKGKAAHGSRPWEGESASFKLLNALHEVKAHFSDQGPQTDTLNIAVIDGGETYNLIPALMTARLEIRFMSSESRATLYAMICDVCARHDLEYKERVTVQPVVTDLTNPFVRAYAASVEAVTGRAPEGVISYAGSDSSYFTQLGIPCIVSCPQGGKHHSVDEWVDKSSLSQFVPILRTFLEQTSEVATR